MSSIRRILSSRANAARSTGPLTPEGKRRCSQNALRHGLLSRHIIMQDESPECFTALLQNHLDRLQPADSIEFGMVEEMVAAHWRQRRAWAIETRLLENEAAADTSADRLDRMANAFASLAAKPSLGLIHRYETRLHTMYQRGLHNLLLLRAVSVPNEPNPISGHSYAAGVPNEPSPISGHLDPPAALPSPDSITEAPPTPDSIAEPSIAEPSITDSTTRDSLDGELTL